ncbi:DUF2637 domain-containing protein [Streptomyces sp. NPDC047525]|uniref:DUF2637 domain-containing protein n=1 Tax=Streptomyces sp. NPDC047525 TaxID=3155264 RepID=UPI0034038FBD
MDLSQWALPSGLAVGGIGTAVAVGMLLGHRRRTGEKNATAEERTQLALQRRQAWQRRLAVIALAIGCVMMFVLAGIAAWLSFGAQREYAHAHNGGDWDAATGFALLLDAGALSLSLIRFFEALTLRSSGLTRVLLMAFVSASAAMNSLHAPQAGAGSAFLAVVPPLVYAVLLEMLLYKVEQVIMGRQQRRKEGKERGYSLLLWLPWPIGAPVKLWQAWRTELLSTVDNVRVTGSRHPHPAPAASAQATPPPAVPIDVPMTTDTVAQHPSVAGADTVEVAATVVNSLPAAGQPPAEQHVQRAAPVAPTPKPTISATDANARAEGEERLGAAPGPAATGTAPPDPEPITDGYQPEPEIWPGTPNVEADPLFKADQGLQLPSENPADDDTQEAEGGPGKAEEASDEDEAGGREPDTQHEHPSPGTGDEEVRERRRIQIDLSTLPKDEGPRQLAERIYVAHQVAGLPLDKGDLGRWAGYTNPRSGGNEYRRLEKEYGPILEREEAASVDLDWSSLDQQSQPATAQPRADEHHKEVTEEAQAA